MFKVPTIKGIIDRRILINFKIDIDILKTYLPKPFEPLDIDGEGIGGICLIRLKNIRPRGFHKVFGFGSENGAHRIAVKWKENGKYKVGVFIPRRDTSSFVNSLAGGKIFPGIHHLSKFTVTEDNQNFEIRLDNYDQKILMLKAIKTDVFSPQSVFSDINEASNFFKQGSIGYSPINKNKFECLELKTFNWKVSPLKVTQVKSSFFTEKNGFPSQKVKFDNALIMENIEHEWIKRETLATT